MDIKVLLGRRIREIRQARGLTQAQFSEFLGIDDKHLSRIELGKNMPNPSVLEKISDVFDIEIKELFEFSHLKSKEDIKVLLHDSINNMTDEQLLLTYKYVRAFVL